MRLFLNQQSENKRLTAILVIVVTLLFNAPVVLAHAKMIGSKPADGEILREKPQAIELTFNEPLQSTEMNAVIVADAAGRRVDKNKAVVSEDGKKLLTELEDLSAGIYTVEWRALSADNHSIKGKFSFTIAGSEAAPVAAEQTPKNVDSHSGHSMPTQENLVNPFQSGARWLMYLAAMTLFGGFAFLLFVLKPAVERGISSLNDEERIFALRRGRNRFLHLAWASLFLLLVSLIANLILQTSDALDVSAAQALSPSNLYQTLTQTAFGLPFLVQIFITLALFGIVFFISRQKEDKTATFDSDDKQTLWRAGLVVSSLLFLMPSLTGHAQAAAGEFRFTVFSDWLHQVAVGAWIGGLFHLILTLPEIVKGIGELQRLSVLSRVIPLFSRMAIACVGLLTLTGIYSSWIHVDGFSALLNTSYGLVLLAKIALFALMLALGGLNSFVLRPRAARLIAESEFIDEKARKFLRAFTGRWCWR